MLAAHSGSRDAHELALHSNGLLGTDKVSVIERYPQVAGLYEHLDFRAFASEAGGERIICKKLPVISRAATHIFTRTSSEIKPFAPHVCELLQCLLFPWIRCPDA